MFHRLSGVLFVFVLLFITPSALTAADNNSVLAQIQKRGQLILGTSGNMPPMTRQLDSGSVVGFDIDLAQVMAQAMGVKLVIKVLPFKELIPALESNKVDVVLSNMTVNPSRNMQVAFVGPYLTSGKCVVTKKATLANAKKATEIDAKKPKVVVLEGSTSEAFAKIMMKNSTVIAVKDNKAGAKMVADNKADALLSDMVICQAIVNSHPEAGFIAINSSLTYEPIGIALSGNDALFINWTDNFLKRLDATGFLQALGKKWLANP